MKNRVQVFIKKLLDNIKRPEMLVLPGQLAFFFVLTIAPILGLLINIVGNTSLPFDLASKINSNLPSFLKGIMDILVNSQADLNWIIFFSSALLLASNGTHSMIIASNTIYGIKNQSYVKRKIKSVIMLLGLILLLVFILLVPIFGDFIVSLITTTLTKDTVLTNIIRVVYDVLKYPISLFGIFFLIKVLYTMAPDKKIKSRTTTYGAVFTSIMWVILTNLYSFYVSVFNNNSFYGNISQLIILMWWIYILAYIFVLGMALNASNYQMDKE